MIKISSHSCKLSYKKYLINLNYSYINKIKYTKLCDAEMLNLLTRTQASNIMHKTVIKYLNT